MFVETKTTFKMEFKDLFADHAYYCSEGNYYSNECNYQYHSFDEFIEEYGAMDFDYNLLFRWDLKKELEEKQVDGEWIEVENGNITLSTFWMQQRKGRFVCIEINNITESDFKRITEFLQPRFEYLKRLWTPLI